MLGEIRVRILNTYKPTRVLNTIQLTLCVVVKSCAKSMKQIVPYYSCPVQKCMKKNGNQV